jgi:outer membrane lipoprotein-sorting protein
MNRKWLIGLSVLAMLSLLLTGCKSGPTAEEIVEKMKDVEASTEDAHAIVEFNIQVEAMDMEVVVELWEERPNKFRAEVLEAGEAEFTGVVSVTDGEQAWLYHPGDNLVVTGALGELESEDIPVNPQQLIQLMEEGIQWATDKFDVELLGEEDLDGIATYKLEFTPKEGEESGLPIPVDGKVTLWVEKDRWIALQAHLDGGSLATGWIRVRSYEFNTGLDGTRFQFEIPEGAEVINIEDMEPVPLTLDEAQQQTEFHLLTPAYVPNGVTLIDVFKVGEALVLRYDHSTTSFTIVQGDLPQPMMQTPSGQTTEVSVRGQTATLIMDSSGNSFLNLTEDGVNIMIAGHVTQDEIIQVAESLQ